MTVIAYQRVSTEKQDVLRQTALFDRELGEGNYTLYTDKGCAGMHEFRDRPAGGRVWEAIEGGDVTDVHFVSIDRAGRRVSDIVSLLHTMADMGIQVHIHDQGLKLLDTQGKLNATSSLVLNVLASVAQIERNLIADRTRAAVQIAREQGKYLGRKPGSKESSEKFLAKPKSRKVRALLEEDYPIKYIAKIVGVSPQLVRKVKSLI